MVHSSEVTGSDRSAVKVRSGLKVPQVAAMFWVVKALTTAFGESASDFLVHSMAPELAVLLGFAAFVLALGLQLIRPDYSPIRYWFAVAMVGVFGTMAADVLHVGLGVPYAISVALFVVVLALVFSGWYRSERTLSMHSICSTRRELYYWAAVVATFALGTAVGDLTAVTLHLGYLAAGVVFACAIAVPAAGFRSFGMNAVAAFWIAYVLTRPVGASFADWLGVSPARGGLGLGPGPVAVVLGLLIVVAVGYLAYSGVDRPAVNRAGRRRAGRSGVAPNQLRGGHDQSEDGPADQDQ